jgi:hypothetical protein
VDLSLAVQSAGATDNTCKRRIYTTRACLTSTHVKALLELLNKRVAWARFPLWDGTCLLGAAIPAIIVSPAAPMHPLAARHAWQKAPWDRQAESTKRNMTVLGGRVASTCML